MHKIKMLTIVILLLFTIHNSSDLRKTVRQNAASDPNFAVSEILRQPLKENAVECEQASDNRHTHQLATAILLVENSVINPIEKSVEFMLAKWLPSLLIYLDLSVGPAQIKPSSFKQSNLSGMARILASVDTCRAITTVAKRIQNTSAYDGSYDSRRRFYESHTGIYADPVYNVIYANLVDGVFYRLLLEPAPDPGPTTQANRRQ